MKRDLLVACLALAGVLGAGCLADTPPAPDPDDGPFMLEMDHDHNDVAHHMASHGLTQEAWSPLDVTLGEHGFANFVMHAADQRLLAFVAIDGDTDGGFTIAEITRPAEMAVLGSYRVPGSAFQEVRVTPDGRWALLNVQELPAPDGVAPAGAGACSVCIHVVDVRDPASPRLSSVLPVELLGTHNMDIVAYPDATYVFYVGQPLNNPYPDPGNRIGVARLVDLGQEAALVPVASFDHNQVERPGRTFPHDVLVQQHPDGRRIAYVSHWMGGHVLFDVTDPLRPTPLAAFGDETSEGPAPIHWIMQESQARPDGRVWAYSAPEIGSRDTDTGFVRSIDVTDPEEPVVAGRWTLPGELHIPGQYLFSPHTAVPHPTRDLLAVAHYHAGVWVLDTSDPEHLEPVAFYLPHGDEEAPHDGPLWWKKPNFDPEGFGPNTYMARWDPGDPDRLWVTDRGTGLYALRLDGP